MQRSAARIMIVTPTASRTSADGAFVRRHQRMARLRQPQHTDIAAVLPDFPGRLVTSNFILDETVLDAHEDGLACAHKS